MEPIFSNIRSVEQPVFSLPDDLLLDNPLTISGLSLLKQIPDQSIPLVFFDPQYRSVLDRLQYGNEGERQKQRAKLPQMQTEIITEFVDEIARILMPSGHLMLWVDKFMLVNGDWHEVANLQTVDMIVWDKMRIGMGYRSRRRSEFLLVFQKSPIRAKGVWRLHNIADVWVEKPDKSHPHAKPIGLIKILIEALTNQGDIVVDPAAGGYNVMRAALLCGRHFLGCDILPPTPEDAADV